MKIVYIFYDFAEIAGSTEFLQSSVLPTIFTLHFCKISLSDAIPKKYDWKTIVSFYPRTMDSLIEGEALWDGIRIVKSWTAWQNI